MSQITPEQLPLTSIVLAGNWEDGKGTTAELSLETHMRIGAYAVRAEQTDQELTVVFTGGLKAANGLSEATAMEHAWNRYFPHLKDQVTVHTDGDCYDTASSAENTREILAQENLLSEKIGFFTSSTHIVRAARSFERHGFSNLLVPVAAEDILKQSGDPLRMQQAVAYEQSFRHHRRAAIEAGLRGLQRIDPEDRLVKYLAKKARPNR